MGKRKGTTEIANTRSTIHGKEMRELVNQSLQEMDAMTNALARAGENPVDAKLKVQQLYFKNLKLAGTPVAMMQKTLAELQTRIELDRMMNPEEDLVSDKYVDLLDTQMRALKTVAQLEGKTTTHKVQIQDDKEMKFTDFIDVDSE
jgi:hypothetical protein